MERPDPRPLALRRPWAYFGALAVLLAIAVYHQLTDDIPPRREPAPPTAEDSTPGILAPDGRSSRAAPPSHD